MSVDFSIFIQEEKTWLGSSPQDRSWCCSRPGLSSPRVQSANNSQGCKVKEYPSRQRLWSSSCWLWYRQELVCVEDTHINLRDGYHWLHWPWVCTHIPAQWEIRCIQLWHRLAGVAYWQKACRRWVQSSSLGNYLAFFFSCLHNLFDFFSYFPSLTPLDFLYWYVLNHVR